MYLLMYPFIHEQIWPFASSVGGRCRTKSFEIKALHAKTREKKAMNPEQSTRKGLHRNIGGVECGGIFGRQSWKSGLG